MTAPQKDDREQREPQANAGQRPGSPPRIPDHELPASWQDNPKKWTDNPTADSADDPPEGGETG